MWPVEFAAHTFALSRSVHVCTRLQPQHTHSSHTCSHAYIHRCTCTCTLTYTLTHPHTVSHPVSHPHMDLNPPVPATHPHVDLHPTPRPFPTSPGGRSPAGSAEAWTRAGEAGGTSHLLSTSFSRGKEVPAHPAHSSSAKPRLVQGQPPLCWFQFLLYPFINVEQKRSFPSRYL